MTPQIRRSDKCPYCGNPLSVTWAVDVKTSVSYTLRMECYFTNCETKARAEVYSKTITRYQQNERRSQ